MSGLINGDMPNILALVAFVLAVGAGFLLGVITRQRQVYREGYSVGYAAGREDGFRDGSRDRGHKLATAFGATARRAPAYLNPTRPLPAINDQTVILPAPRRNP